MTRSPAFSSIVLIDFIRPSAPDLAPSSEWRFRVATTSATVIFLPSWKETSSRILKVHTEASADGSQDAAIDGRAPPVLGSVSTSVSPQRRPMTKSTEAL
jgi:hypothetical protein